MTRYSLAPLTGRLALALLLIAAPACTDLLTEQPKDRISTDAFFQTSADAKAAIAATYRPLSTQSLWGINLQWALNAATDESRVGPEEENPNIVALTQLSWTTTNRGRSHDRDAPRPAAGPTRSDHGGRDPPRPRSGHCDGARSSGPLSVC